MVFSKTENHGNKIAVTSIPSFIWSVNIKTRTQHGKNKICQVSLLLDLGMHWPYVAVLIRFHYPKASLFLVITFHSLILDVQSEQRPNAVQRPENILKIDAKDVSIYGHPAKIYLIYVSYKVNSQVGHHNHIITIHIYMFCSILSTQKTSNKYVKHTAGHMDRQKLVVKCTSPSPFEPRKKPLLLSIILVG